jgi:hypothetical protein
MSKLRLPWDSMTTGLSYIMSEPLMLPHSQIVAVLLGHLNSHCLMQIRTVCLLLVIFLALVETLTVGRKFYLASKATLPLKNSFP